MRTVIKNKRQVVYSLAFFYNYNSDFKISLRLKEGKTLDTAALNTAVAAAGPQFKIQIPAEKK